MRNWRSCNNRKRRRAENRNPIWFYHRGPLRPVYSLGVVSPNAYTSIECVLTRKMMTSRIEEMR